MNKTLIEVGSINCRVHTKNMDVLNKLHKSLRFRPKNYFHSPAYKKKKWDGWKDFFNKNTGKFMTGLLPEVKAALTFMNVGFEIADKRNKVKWKHDRIEENFLNELMPENAAKVQLRDFQVDLANMCFKHDRGIVQAPTSAGKTLILISILRSLPPKTPVLFLTNRASLVQQNYLEMKKWGVQDLGRWYGNYKEPNYVICATCHSKTFESLDSLLPKFKVLLVDEVHDCMSDVPIKAYKKMINANIRIGFSATPFKWNKKKIDNCHKYLVKGNFGPVFKTKTTETGLLTTKELQNRGNLAASNCIIYPINTPELTHEPYQDAIKLGIEQNFDFHNIIKRLVKTLNGRTLIIVERIEQGEYLKSLMPDAHWIQGKNSLDEREPVLDKLKKGGDCVAIIMKQIITAGIDVKIHNLINAAGGEGAHNIIQIMGRGLRTSEDKDILNYYDFIYNINPYLLSHSLWRTEVLEKEGHNVTIKDSIDF